MDSGMDPVNWLFHKRLFTRSVRLSLTFSNLNERSRQGFTSNELHLFSFQRYGQCVKIGQFSNGWRDGSRQLIVVQFPIHEDMKWVKISQLYSKGRQADFINFPLPICGTHNVWRLVNRPMDAGMVPVNWLLDKRLFTKEISVVLLHGLQMEDRELHFFWSLVYLQCVKIGEFTDGWRYDSRQTLRQKHLFREYGVSKSPGIFYRAEVSHSSVTVLSCQLSLSESVYMSKVNVSHKFFNMNSKNGLTSDFFLFRYKIFRPQPASIIASSLHVLDARNA